MNERTMLDFLIYPLCCFAASVCASFFLYGDGGWGGGVIGAVFVACEIGIITSSFSLSGLLVQTTFLLLTESRPCMTRLLGSALGLLSGALGVFSFSRFHLNWIIHNGYLAILMIIFCLLYEIAVRKQANNIKSIDSAKEVIQ